jgi:hypothetical protein
MANQNLNSVLAPRDATRAQSKACIVIEGLSGSGKTGLALLLAYYLGGEAWDKVCLTDTENRSANLYVGTQLSIGAPCGVFKKIDLLASYGYAPSNYLICKENALKIGCKAVINDSISHMWQMAGGVLQRVSELEKANSKVNKFSAWGTDEIVTEKNAIYDVIRDNRVHVISTVRIKEKHEMVDGKVKSLGEQQIFMPDAKYEPDLVLHMEQPGTGLGGAPAATVSKSRYTILQVGETYAFTEALIKQLVSYLNEGADPAVLQEQQRLDYIAAITDILNTNVSKQTMFPLLKEQLGCKDIALTELPLDKVRTLLGMLIN